MRAGTLGPEEDLMSRSWAFWSQRRASSEPRFEGAYSSALPGHEEMERFIEDAAREGIAVSLVLLEVQGLRAVELVRSTYEVADLLDQVAEHLAAQAELPLFRLAEAQFAIVVDDEPEQVEDRAHELLTLPRGARACIGIARSLGHDVPGILHDRAELALEQARRHGPGSIVTRSTGGDPTRHVSPVHARALVQLLHDGEVRVHYQPIVSLQERRLLGFEALARPQLGYDLTGPNVAFTVAQRMGLAVDLDELCRRSIFADAPGLTMPPAAQLHVNLSGEALGHVSLSAAALAQQVRAAGIEPERVVFEVRQAGGTSLGGLRDELQGLRRMGFGLCLDDIGTGGNGIGVLGSDAFSTVKLSPRITSRLGRDRHAEAFLDALCAYARRVGIQVIVAGVETSDQLAWLRRYRLEQDRPIRGVQGYHLGAPTRHPRVAQPGDEEVGGGLRTSASPRTLAERRARVLRELDQGLDDGPQPPRRSTSNLVERRQGRPGPGRHRR